MEAIDGVRSIQIADENQQLRLDFTFDQLIGLNEAMQSNQKNDDYNVFCWFSSRTKKKLKIEFVIEKPVEAEPENREDSTNEMETNADGLYEMVDYRFTFQFTDVVKRFDGTPAVLGADEKTLFVTQNMKQIISDDFLRALEVALK